MGMYLTWHNQCIARGCYWYFGSDLLKSIQQHYARKLQGGWVAFVFDFACPKIASFSPFFRGTRMWKFKQKTWNFDFLLLTRECESNERVIAFGGQISLARSMGCKPHRAINLCILIYSFTSWLIPGPGVNFDFSFVTFQWSFLLMFFLSFSFDFD